MINRRHAILAGIALAAPVTGRAQTPLGPIEALSEQGLYLPELGRLREAVKSSPAQGQILAQFRATLGDEAGALREWWMAMRPATAPAPPPDTTDYGRYRAEPALEAIVAAARGRRLVILNEAHHASRCRAFAARVLGRLRAEGFDLLAAEDFTSDPEARFAERMTNGEPVTTDLANYTRDPVYAELIRQARAGGYRLACYEMTPAQRPPEDADGPTRIATREAAEAANLAALLKDNPNARVVVYCGHGHLAERTLGSNTVMATRLKATTGIDPLTIDQSLGLPSPAGIFESPTVTAVLAHFKPTEPIIVRAPDGASMALGPFTGAVDLTVFHPRLEDVEGRPGWLATAPDRARQVFALPAAGPGDRLLQAVPLAEASAPNVIPSDQYMAKPGAREAVFFLRPGRYEIRLETDAGRQVLRTL